MFIAAPCISLFGVFFGPMIRDFHWSHAQVSRTATGYSFAMGLSAPLVGWLIERVRVQWVMAAGALIAGAAYIGVSQAHSLLMVVAMFAAIGLGNQAATTLPGVYVAATWFEQRRGLAIGVMLAGMSLGMVIAPPAVTALIVRYGWRWAIACMGIPMIAIAAPIALLLIRIRASGTEDPHAARAELPGVEMDRALRSSSFWLLMALEFFYFMTFGAVYFHIVPYLISIGFGAQRAANIFGIQASLAAVGWVATGYLADRYPPKLVLEGALVLLGLSVVGLLGARYNLAFIALFLLFWAATAGASASIVPLLVGQTFGLRRFASINGIVFLMRAAGTAVAPLITGKLIDVTGGYSLAFELALVYLAITALANALIYPVPGYDRTPAETTASYALESPA
ncbi:MAG TPA: MFS transporter [Candidatus Binataceae bacterium]|nr:MFS transporter [Candidatus Binataceae bacterium]